MMKNPRYLLSLFLCFGASIAGVQSAQVAQSSLSYNANPDEQTLEVGFRLVDEAEVKSVRGIVDKVPLLQKVTLEKKESESRAWSIVIDVSDPKRAETIKICRSHASNLIKKLDPQKDTFEVCSLARELVPVIPFGANLGVAQKGWQLIKPRGNDAKATLLWSNAQKAIDRLARQPQKRKAMLLLTDGQDETPNAVQAEGARESLVKAAQEAGIMIHTIGYAERPEDHKFHDALQRISQETEGLYTRASLVDPNKKNDVTDAQLSHIWNVTRSGWSAILKVPKPAPKELILAVTSSAGGVAQIAIPAAEIKKVFPPKPKPGDADGDGINDEEEIKNGTNPNKADSDGDGLNDNVETKTGTFVDGDDTGTDPNKADSDGDGLNDKVETKTGTFVDGDDTGTDPNKVDSDGDGLNDNVETKTGTFVDGDDTGTDPNKADTDGDGLNDNVETKTGIFIDEENTGTDPNNADSDGDGLSDAVESNTGIFVDGDDTGTDPHRADTDGDGLTDAAETNTGKFKGKNDVGSDPNKIDTDSDGISDGDEVESKMDPNVKASQWQLLSRKKWFMPVAVGVLILVIVIVTVICLLSRKKKARARAEEAELARLEEQQRQAEETNLDSPAMATIDEQTRIVGPSGKGGSGALAWLEMCDSQQTREPITVPNLRIGRGRHNDLVFQNNSVSGNHCVIERKRDGQWQVTDLKSGNGVLVNGKDVQQGPINDGDIIEMGEIKMRFVLA